MHSQNALSSYLVADFLHTIGAYHRSNEELPDPDGLAGTPIADCVRLLTMETREYNERLISERYAVRRDQTLRRPPPPAPSTTDHGGTLAATWPTAERDCLDYYATVTAALELPSDDASVPLGPLQHVRSAILLDVAGDTKRIRALRTRFQSRAQFLRASLDVTAPATPGRERADRYWNADLDQASGLATSVLAAAAEANWLSHVVQQHRSGPVGHVMQQVADGASTEDDRLLRRAIALNTFVFSISEAMPWIFARDNTERAGAQRHDRAVRDRVRPFEPLWIARRMILQALYRRAFVWRLLGDHRRSYNDYWKTQHIVRLTKLVKVGDEPRLMLNILDALAEYRIAELYRADHDYRQALVYSCRSHDRMENLMRATHRPNPARLWLESSHWRLALLLSKGKAFYEQGQMKRACKWFLRAWLALDDVITRSRPNRAALLSGAAREQIEDTTAWLAEVRHEPDFPKQAMQYELAPAIAALDKRTVPPELHALAADILDRLGHTLMVMRLSDSQLARRCLELALDLDPANLLARSDLLQLRSRDANVTLPRGLPDPVNCWPAGGTVVEQVIRLHEHFTRERLDSAETPRADSSNSTADRLVAHALLDDFLTHTDSMHVRAGLVYQHLAPTPTSVKREWPMPAMEFVCLRRYGSTSPFMARPAAVQAIGGGYLVRLLGGSTCTNILIDPGDGIVANLYRVGFAISDLDMILVTHDHPDHMAGLDPILALRKEHVHSRDVLPIYGNPSVVARYGSAQLETALIRPLPTPDEPPLQFGAGDAGIATIRTLPTMHPDLGGHNALGFTLTLTEPKGTRVGALTFMSDTAADAVRSALWGEALEAEVVVAHISNTSVDELQALAFAGTLTPRRSRAFDDLLIRLRDSDAHHAAVAFDKLQYALALTESPPHKHLLLAGLLEVAQRFRAASTSASGRVLVIGEFKEQLGPFRGKIARNIARQVLHGDGHTALTADIGLRLRIATSGVSVLCSTCALNNDRLQPERYHPAREIREVCIKGNFEGMAWNCERHNPGTMSPTPRFWERIAGYDVFGPAGLFNG